MITLSEELSLGDRVDALSQEPSPETVVIVQEGQRLIFYALTRLPPFHRDILVFVKMNVLSYAESSQISHGFRGHEPNFRACERPPGADGQIKGASKRPVGRTQHPDPNGKFQ